MTNQTTDQPVDLPKRINSRLSFADIANILRLEAGGATHRDIAAVFKVHQSTVSRILQEFSDTRAIAKVKLHASAAKLAEHVITASEKAANRGDGSVALESLDRLSVLERKRDTGSQGPKVTIVVGGPHVNPPAYALPAEIRAKAIEGNVEE